MTEITPTVGRVVWYYRSRIDHASGMIKRGNHPFKADIVFVWNDRLVNLVVVDHDGCAFQIEKVKLLQDGDLMHEDEAYWAWMPYQIGQAKKHAAPEVDHIQLRRWCIETAIQKVDRPDSVLELAAKFYDWAIKAS